ncbi:VOC family protein [Chitinophaga lutea]
MAQINAYLNFKGTCEEAFNFYKSVFGGEFPHVARYKDMPAKDAQEHGSEGIDGEKIMHMSLPISKETVLLGSDIGGEWASNIREGNNIQLSVNAGSEEEATRIFKGLSAGGQILIPLDKTFWGAFFGSFVDKFGITWMVNYDYGRKG